MASGIKSPGRRELAAAVAGKRLMTKADAILDEGIRLRTAIDANDKSGSDIDWTNCPAVCRNDDAFRALAIEAKRAERDRENPAYIKRVMERMRLRYNDLMGIGNA